MPLRIGNFLPVPGHIKWPSKICKSNKMICRDFRRSSTITLPIGEVASKLGITVSGSMIGKLGNVSLPSLLIEQLDSLTCWNASSNTARSTLDRTLRTRCSSYGVASMHTSEASIFKGNPLLVLDTERINGNQQVDYVSCYSGVCTAPKRTQLVSSLWLVGLILHTSQSWKSSYYHLPSNSWF